MSSTLGQHFFRHEFGRLVAMLSRRVGVQHLESVEDAVQSALLSAVESWSRDTLPDNPSAWLFRVAHNVFIGELRGRLRRDALNIRHGHAVQAEDEAPSAFLAGEVRDDLLRMLFVCCDPTLPIESQLVLALKTLCGFDIREIAERLFTSDANVYKRLARARNRLREVPLAEDELAAQELVARLPAVQAVLYLMFTEGYLSSHAENAIRQEMCDEAIRLAQVLAEHPLSAQPETFALLALMHLQRARSSARQDVHGGLLLLEEQDRSLWNREEIYVGLTWLARSAEGGVFSRYHAEAGIAAEHCLAPTFAETRWERIVECYALLERQAPSPLHTVNRALAAAESRGPGAGLAMLEALAPPAWFSGSYLWHAALADLHMRCGHAGLAQSHGDAALAQVPSEALRAVLARRLARVDPAAGAGPRRTSRGG
jgi:RNA polymerase sigma factor (sigma-70 family)